MFWLKNAIEGSPVVFVVVLEVHQGINECLASNAERLVLDPLIGTFDDDERHQPAGSLGRVVAKVLTSWMTLMVSSGLSCRCR